MSLRFAVVHEAPADHLTATELADRVLVGSIDWLEEGQLEFQRTWLTEWNGEALTWKQIKRSALDAGIDAIGFFDGDPAAPDARAALRAIRYLRFAMGEPDAVVLLRDQDDQPDRRAGLEQARRREEIGQLRVIIGLAVVERESWVISGFDPLDEEETARLESERQELGFDPRQRSHQLTACKDDQAKRSPKRVLRVLCDDDRDRERLCWTTAPLETLSERGAKNGLAEFLKEVSDHLARLIEPWRKK